MYPSVPACPYERAKPVCLIQEIASPIAANRPKDCSKQKLYQPVSVFADGRIPFFRRSTALYSVRQCCELSLLSPTWTALLSCNVPCM